MASTLVTCSLNVTATVGSNSCHSYCRDGGSVSVSSTSSSRNDGKRIRGMDWISIEIGTIVFLIPPLPIPSSSPVVFHCP